MDAIETRFLGATNTRSSRIKASTLGNYGASITLSYDHALNSWDNHRAAAEALIAKLGWTDTSFYGGETAHGTVWVADIGSRRFIRVIDLREVRA